MAVVWVVLKIVLWVLLALVTLVAIALFLPITAELKYNAQDGFLLKVGALFLRFQLFPSRPKRQKKQRWWHRKKQPAAKKTEPTPQTPPQPPKEEAAQHAAAPQPQQRAQVTPQKAPPQPAASKPPKPKKKKPISQMNLNQLAKQEPVEKKLKLSLDLVKKVLPLAGTSMKRLLWSLRFHHICINLPVHADDAAKTAVQVGQINAGLGAAFGVLQNFLRLRFQQTEIWADYHGEHRQEAFFSCKITAQLYIMLIVGIWALLQLRREKII